MDANRIFPFLLSLALSIERFRGRSELYRNPKKNSENHIELFKIVAQRWSGTR